MDGTGWFIVAVIAFNIVRAIMKSGKEEEASAPPPPPVRPSGPPPARRLKRIPSAPVEEVEAWEETRSLEVEERVESLEGRGTGRTLRVRVDRDEEAQGVSEKRKVAAASRDGAITTGDHAAFDGTIRAAVAAPVILTKGRDDLRRAMIWREVLGPPVSLREE